jgi:hypothetical protein
MGTSAAASDVQKNFGLWHDKALQEPVAAPTKVRLL